MQARYDEFAEAFMRTAQRLRTWEQSHRQFAEELVVGLARFGQVPADGLRFDPDAMTIDDDGWLVARFTFLIVPHHGSVDVQFRVRSVRGEWTAEYAGREFRGLSTDALEAFYAAVFENLIEFLDNLQEPVDARHARIGVAAPH